MPPLSPKIGRFSGTPINNKKCVPYEKETNYLLFTSRRYSGEPRTYLL